MTKLLKISVFAVPACAMLALAQPATATDGSRTTTAAAAAATSASAETGNRRAARPKYYCMNVSLTGSRLARPRCKTKGEWLDQGVDPDAKK